MIKRLIFDVDKTLILGVSYDKQVENTLRKIGYYSKLNKEKFIGAMLSYENNYSSYTKEDYAQHIARNIGLTLDSSYIEIYFEELKTAIPLTFNEELINALNTLSKHYELVLLTNYFEFMQMNRLNSMGLGHFFQECHGERIIKPNEEAFLDAIGSHAPEECIMIGDNLNVDILPARKLRLNTIFINPEHIPIDNLDIPEINKVEDITLELIESIENKKTLKLH